MVKRAKTGVGIFFVLSCLIIFNTSSSYADTLQSSHYQFSETTIGAGGLNQSSSANYQGRDSIGDLGVGTSSSANYQIAAGNTTTNDPALSVSINGVTNFGNFSSTNAATATTTFTVLNYTTYGYVAQIVGSPP